MVHGNVQVSQYILRPSLCGVAIRVSLFCPRRQPGDSCSLCDGAILHSCTVSYELLFYTLCDPRAIFSSVYVNIQGGQVFVSVSTVNWILLCLLLG